MQQGHAGGNFMSSRVEEKNLSLSLFSSNFETVSRVTLKQLNRHIKIKNLNKRVQFTSSIILHNLDFNRTLTPFELLKINQALNFTQKKINEVCKASIRLNATATNRKVANFLKKILKKLHRISSSEFPLKKLQNLQIGVWNTFLGYGRDVIESDKLLRAHLFERMVFPIYADQRRRYGAIRTAVTFAEDFAKIPTKAQLKFMQTRAFYDNAQLLYQTKEYLTIWTQSGKKVNLFPETICYQMALLHYELEEVTTKLKNIESNVCLYT